ncbi:hypothetical protein E4U11_004790 [Claviceps purpurea]|nr:hypothetical protein E4U11_004790 [Claviceps purpurea]
MTQVSQSALTLLLKLSPNLEALYAWPLPWGCFLPLDVNHWNRLRFVMMKALQNHFHKVPVDLPGGFPKTFLQNSANSLVHLHFEGIPQQWYNGITSSIPRLHNLRILEMNHYGPSVGIPFRIFILCDAFPRLEQLKIGPNLPYLGPEPMAVSPKRWERLWPFLTVLRFDTWTFGDGPEADRLAEMTRSTLRYLTCLNRGNPLEHIQFNFPHQNGRCFSSDDHDLLPDFDVTEHSEYRNLKSFNLRMVCMPPDRVRTLLCNAIETKKMKLTSFDIVFPQGPPTAGEPIGGASIRHLQGYEWFRGTSTIHTLGCYDFRFRSGAENDEDLPLPQFLASFPNLRTLSIHSEHYNKLEFASVVVAIIKRTHLKTIYTPSVDCEVLGQQLRQVARDHGVELIDGDRPDEWPIKLSE